MNYRYDGKQQIKMFPSNRHLLDKNNIVLKGEYDYVLIGYFMIEGL